MIRQTRQPVNGNRLVVIRFNQAANQYELTFIEYGATEETHNHRLRDSINPLEIDQFIFDAIEPGE